MEFNKKQYLEDFGQRFRLEDLVKNYNENPHKIQVRQGISSELYQDPMALAGVSCDVIDNYVNLDIFPKVEDFTKKIHETTKINLDKILNDLTGEYSSINEALNLIMPLPSYNVEGGRYRGLSDAHINAKEAQELYSEKNVEKIIENLTTDYGLSKEGLAYHASVNSEGLINVFGRTILQSKIQKLGSKLSDKDNNLDKAKTTNFAKYLINKSEGESESYALELLSRNAFQMYASKDE